MSPLTINQIVKSGGRQFNRSFKVEYYENTNWLCGCDERNSLFCFPCLLFGGNPWTKFGMKDIKDVYKRQSEVCVFRFKNNLQEIRLNMNTNNKDVYKRQILHRVSASKCSIMNQMTESYKINS